MQAPDEELMLAYRGGQAGAFETLYARHRGPLYRFLLRAIKERSLAEELFEELSEEAYKRSGYPSVRGVHAWMHDEMDFGEHFQALRNQLARRVLQRDYPEGWVMRPRSSSEMRLD